MVVLDETMIKTIESNTKTELIFPAIGKGILVHIELSPAFPKAMGNMRTRIRTKILIAIIEVKLVYIHFLNLES